VTRFGNRFRLCRRAALVLCSLVVVSGCSDPNKGRPKVVPVTGAVAYNGKPIEGATVIFWVVGSPRPANGTTDEKGEFKLSTFAIDDGCVPGEAKITVVKERPRTGGETNPAAPGDPVALAKIAQENAKKKAPDKPLIPLKYSQETSTPLKETVKAEGENRFVIQLSD
jgi:hypothetical protein